VDSGAFEKRGDVAWLVIDRPQARNALAGETVRWLRRCLSEVREDPAVRAVVLTGAGDRYFSAGGDLGEMPTDAARDPLEEHFERAHLNSVFDDLKYLGKPTIARVCGLALAGGFGLALGCDFIIAAENAEFGLPEAHVGLWPHIVTGPLTLFVPAKVALQLMLTGKRLSVADGVRLGFVYATAPVEGIDDAVDDLLSVLRRSSPEAIRLGKTTFYKAIDAEPGAGMALLEAAMTMNLGLPDAREGIAAFRERRAPRWRSIT
jgi:enoyl-CoA hydratase